MTPSLQTQWNKFLEVIQQKLPPSTNDYKQWFEPIKPINWENNILTIRVPSTECYMRIEQSYLEVLSQGLMVAFGQGVQLQYQIPKDHEREPKVDRTEYPNSVGLVSSDEPTFVTHLDSRLSLDTFYESICNRLAYSAAIGIIEKPGKNAFNPLFVHGASGVGKTHIIHAIGNEIIKREPDKKVVYVPAQTFKRQFVTATIVDKNTDHFFDYYQNIDVLLIDDIQELSDAVATQNAFFQIFNNLKLLGKQICITSDRAPAELKGLEERLYTRLKWGLTVEIGRPDAQLRKIILRNKVEEAGVELPEDVFNFIVKHAKDNVRDLEGTLTSLMAHSLFSDQPLNLELAKQVMAQTVGIEESTLTLNDILKIVGEYYNLSREVIIGRKRTRVVTTARQMVMYLAKEYTDTPLKAIGRELGNRDHSTVIYGHKSIDNLRSTDTRLAKELSEIIELLNI